MTTPIGELREALGVEMTTRDVALLSAALDELEALRKENGKLRKLATFLRSVIKCGEPWTDTCERVYAGLEELP